MAFSISFYKSEKNLSIDWRNSSSLLSSLDALLIYSYKFASLRGGKFEKRNGLLSSIKSEIRRASYNEKISFSERHVEQLSGWPVVSKI